jgi:hypothetical protein
MRKSLFIAAALLLSSGPATEAFAQNASVSGSVADSAGALIPGVEVTAANVNTGIVTTSISNETGAYNFASLQPGTYKLTASLPGFQTVSFNDVRLSQDQQVRFNFELMVGQIATVVDVTVDANVSLATTTATVGDVLPSLEVAALPLGNRDVLGLVGLAAGAVGNNFAGQRDIGITTTRDGLVVGNQRTNSGAGTATFSSADLVEEVQVLVASIDAATGRGTGQVKLQTRSGTNNFHGALFYSDFNSGLSSRNWFQTLSGTALPYTNRHQFGGRLGGPVVKNKAFFFFLYEGQRQYNRQSVISRVLTPEARSGVFRYFNGVRNGNATSTTPAVDLNGNLTRPIADLRSFNLFSDVRDPFRPGIDPYIQTVLAKMPLPNNWTIGDGLNTAGINWLRRVKNMNRDTYNARLDYQLTSNNKVSFMMSKQKDASPGNLASYPDSFNGSDVGYPKTYVAAWTATISPRVLNEVRFGMQATDLTGRSPSFLGCCKGDSVTDRNEAGKEALNFLPIANGYPIDVWYTGGTSTAAAGALLDDAVVSFGTASDRDNHNPLYQISDTFSWIKGAHSFKVGFEAISQWSDAWNMTAKSMIEGRLGAGNFPITRITSTNFAGLNANDATTAQNLLYDLAGSMGNVTQGFIVNRPGDKDWLDFKQDFRRYRNFRQDDYFAFFADSWQLRKNLTVNFGVRWEKYGPGYEQGGMGTVAKGGQAGIFGISGRDFGALWNPGASGGSLTEVELVGKNSPNPDKTMYPVDNNNFAPAVGLSWNLPWFSRQTVLRSGYGISYAGNFGGFTYERMFGNNPGGVLIRDETPTSYTSLSNTGSVLPLSTLGVRPFDSIPLIRSGFFVTYADDRATPYVQNWNLSIERELARNLNIEVGYVANKSSKLFQPVELNFPNLLASWKGSETLLEAFKATQAGGNAPLFDAMLKGVNFGSAIGTVGANNLTGSQALRRYSGTNAFIANGSVAEFADWLNSTNFYTGTNGGLVRLNGFPENFITVNPQFRNAQIYGNNNAGSYQSMQVKVTRRMSQGFSSQFAYTWSKAIGNAVSGPTTRAELGVDVVDPRDLSKNWGRLPYDLTNTITGHGTWELPFGSKQRFLSSAPGWLEKVVGGWQLSGILSYQSGAPLTVTSTAYTMAFSPQDPGKGGLTGASLPTVDLLTDLPKSAGKVKVGNGFVQYFPDLSTTAAPSTAFGSDPDNIRVRNTNQIVIDSSGRTVFQNPAPGTVGNAGIAYLQGPGQFGLDMALMKRVQFREGMSFTIRGDAVNVLNKPQWGAPNMNINSSSFGRITSAMGARTITINARVDF